MPSLIEEKLPTELKVLILQALPDFTSLIASIRTCRSFHSAYEQNTHRILASVLNKFIHPAIQADARALPRDVASPPDTYEKAASLEEYGETLANAKYIEFFSTPTPRPLSQQFKRAVTLHNNIEDLTSDLCAFISTKVLDHVQGAPTAAIHPSQAETIRIQRAPYRLNTFCMTRRFTHAPQEDIRDAMLLPLPPWELDELGCIHDYLVNRVSGLVDEVIEAHLAGEDAYYQILFSPSTCPSRGMPHWVGVLFGHGVSGLNALVSASKDFTLTRRHRLSNIFRMYQRLEAGQSVDWSPCRALVHKPEPEHFHTPAFEQGWGIAGPNAAWIWAHREHDPLDYYKTEKADLGDWCASLWDDERLEVWEALKNPWTIKNLQQWRSKSLQQHQLERRKRMMADPDRPKRMPCNHGNNTDVLPQNHGLLVYRGRTEDGNHEFSSCLRCFNKLQKTTVADGQAQCIVIRYGRAR